MTALRRRGACPTLAAPMSTGDGLLARLAIRGTVALDDFAALCVSARRHGSGVIEITARGNLQVRGLREASAPLFAVDVLKLDLGIASGVPITVNPLAGLEPGEAVSAADLAAELDRALAASPLAGLGPKVSVVIDGGGPLHLDDVAADVRLTAWLPTQRFHVAVGGDAASAASLGSVATADAVGATVRLLAVIAARGRRARARDIVCIEGLMPFRRPIANVLTDAPAAISRPPFKPMGIHPLRDGAFALGLALPFGHAHSGQLQLVIREALRACAAGLRLAQAHTLFVVGLDSSQAAANLQRAAGRLGFIVEASDPRRHVAACPGAPYCASAALSTRDLAPGIATAAAALLDGSFTLHLSGCPKGCAHPGRAGLTVAGGEATAGLVINGAAHDPATCETTPDQLPSVLARLAAAIGVARQPGETAANALARCGEPLLAGVLDEAAHG